LTTKYRCISPTCNRSSTRAPLLLLFHHACGPSCKSQVYIINFSHSKICFIITISTTNKTFFQSFLNILCFFSFHPLIMSFFVQPHLSFLFLYLDCYCPTIIVLFFWTVIVWSLLRFLTISRNIELRFKRD
jgi:hypothetical protein